MCGDWVDEWMVSCSALAVVRGDEPAGLHGDGLVAVHPDGGAAPPGRPWRRRASTSPTVISPRKATLSSSSSNSGGFERIQGVLVGDDRIEPFDVLVDQLERVLGDVAVIGHDQRDRVADVAHLVGGQGVDRRRVEPRHHVHADGGAAVPRRG